MKALTLRRATGAQPAGTTSVRTPSKHRLLSCAGIALLAIGLSDRASAEPTTVGSSVSFNFNVPADTRPNAATGMQLSMAPGTGSGLGATANSKAISRYMTATLHNAGYRNSSVDVQGAIGTASYTGEGYVWGDSLGTTDGKTFNPAAVPHHSIAATATPKDGFIINNNFGLYGEKTSPFFTMNFTNFIVDTVSYDWEIFPDATCPNNNCRTLPDMTLWASGTRISGTTGKQITAANETAQRFDSAGYAPQNMGTLSHIAVNGATGLRFQDWPAEIGIDNLVITGHVVPEPATLPLLAGGLLGLGWLARRRQDALNG